MQVIKHYTFFNDVIIKLDIQKKITTLDNCPLLGTVPVKNRIFNKNISSNIDKNSKTRLNIKKNKSVITKSCS